MLTDDLKSQITSTYRTLKEKVPGFRVRRPQQEMIGAIATGLSEPGGIVVIEAQTGTGKSMGYLVPALALAEASGKKVVVATATIALQEQLYNKDIPSLLAATGRQHTVVIAKGRRRYLCVRNLRLLGHQDASQQELGLGEGAVGAWPRLPRAGEVDKVQRLHDAFQAEQWDGDMDATPEPVDEDLRQLLTTSAGGCANRRCAFADRCPFMRARAQIQAASIVVTNQDLLLSDLMIPSDDDSNGGVLLPKPAESLYIIDEAHHLPAKAVEQGAAQVSLSSSIRWLQKTPALARSAYGVLGKEKVGGLTIEDGTGLVESLRAELEAMERQVLSTWTPDQDNAHDLWRASLGQLPEAWRVASESLQALAATVHKWLASLRRRVMEAPGHLDANLTGTLARELGLAAEKAEDHEVLWGTWAEEEVLADYPPIARWVTRGNDGHLLCHASGVTAGGLLRRILWEQAGGVVLTSATLAGGDEFRRLRIATGLPEHALLRQLPSPFDLTRQGRVEIPRIEAMPEQADAHMDAIAAWLETDLDWSRGNLVLFTSRKKMQGVFDRLSKARRERVKLQGARSRGELLEQHGKDIEDGRGSTLFGLASFGEGTDLPGRLCETVVITQLPFAVPTEPVSATYAEWLETRGRNPFVEVTVPEATRVLIQYCGRLIRTETDTGRIVILDRRIVSKRYGSTMLRALPPFAREVDTNTRPARERSYA